jgi:hypothetical protein
MREVRLQQNPLRSEPLDETGVRFRSGEEEES